MACTMIDSLAAGARPVIIRAPSKFPRVLAESSQVVKATAITEKFRLVTPRPKITIMKIACPNASTAVWVPFSMKPAASKVLVGPRENAAFTETTTNSDCAVTAGTDSVSLTPRLRSTVHLSI